MTILAQLLVEAGLIQFGWFRRNEENVPFALHLDMLVSYPEILTLAASQALKLVGAVKVSRLLCTADSVPLAVAVSLQSGIPLVASRGTTEQPVSDLVGAYDIGHPALLLTNTTGWHGSPAQLISGARRVGLEVDTILPLIEVRAMQQEDGIAVLPVLRLADVVTELRDSGRLSADHVRAVFDWMAEA